MPSELIWIKQELLCWGVKVLPTARSVFKDRGIKFNGHKKIHGAHIRIGREVYVNACFSEAFSEKSPYCLSYEQGAFSLSKDGIQTIEVQVEMPPKWMNNVLSNGMYVCDFVDIHGGNVIALSTHYPCCYMSRGLGCRFCSSKFGSVQSEKLVSKLLIEVLDFAYESNNDYSLSLSGGVQKNSSRGMRYYSNVIKLIRKRFAGIKISVEATPPVSVSSIHELHESGAQALSMNLELFNDRYRKKYCPGKSEISKEDYFTALKEAVSLFSIGNVSSVLIVGLEPYEETLHGSKEFIDIGVLPVLIPFRPYDLCDMAEHPTTDPILLKNLQKELVSYVKKTNKFFERSCACLACNACSGSAFVGGDLL